jgi:undecaprenyl-diphosphatase
MDTAIVHALNAYLHGHDAVEDPALTYASAAEALFAGGLILAFVLAAGPLRLAVRRAVVAAGISAGAALALGNVVAHLVDRPRPFVAHPLSVHLFAAHPADSGFPSDHATASFAIAVALLLRDRRWGLPVLGCSIVLAVARVALGLHYPTDVLAGAALGAAVALVLWLPPARTRLDALADGAGALLDGAARAVVRRGAGPARAVADPA